MGAEDPGKKESMNEYVIYSYMCWVIGIQVIDES
jgi:hypothetical protein